MTRELLSFRIRISCGSYQSFIPIFFFVSNKCLCPF
ncbi:unnamed protein product, partial [Arabidopsis halleri]